MGFQSRMTELRCRVEVLRRTSKSSDRSRKQKVEDRRRVNQNRELIPFQVSLVYLDSVFGDRLC